MAEGQDKQPYFPPVLRKYAAENENVNENWRQIGRQARDRDNAANDGSGHNSPDNYPGYDHPVNNAPGYGR